MKKYRDIFVKLVLSLLLIVIEAPMHQVMSSPAFPGFIDFKQPDGSVIKVRLMGDEDLRWAETEDGYTLLFDDSGYLVYAEKNEDGDLIATDIRAANEANRSDSVKSRLSVIGKRLTFSDSQINSVFQSKQARSRSMFQSDTRATTSKPVVGLRKQLVILVDFPDKPFTLTVDDFDDLLNQEHNPIVNPLVSSVRDYYREASFGQLDLVSTVVGVYTMPMPAAYYGSNHGSHDTYARNMVGEAITQADKDIDFSEFDNDGDGYVDGIHIIYAGHGEEAGGGSDCIWAHASSIYGRFDGVQLGRYSCSAELRSNIGRSRSSIGPICHEIGHVLGTMDFYDTDYDYGGGQYGGTGEWDLMSQGSWNYNGDCPAPFNPYTVVYDYGWSEAKIIDSPSFVTLKAWSKEEGYVRINTGTRGEFYMFEYRNKEKFGFGTPGKGMLIYHAKDNLSNKGSNKINSSHQQQFYIVSANAPVDIPNQNPSSYGQVNSSACPFPGALQRTEFTDYTTPSMRSWDGCEVGLPITSIEEDIASKYVQFAVSNGSTDIAYGLKADETGVDFISLSWNVSSDVDQMMLVCSESCTFGQPEARDYVEGETIVGGGNVIYVGKDLFYTHSGLNNQTYYYCVYTWKNNEWKGSAVKRIMTQADVVRTFPYKEDFESRILHSSWTQELYEGNAEFAIDYNVSLDQTYLTLLQYQSSYYTRLILPKMDFTGHDKATLSFDYSNGIAYAKLYYRRSESDEWHLLANLDKHDVQYACGDSHIDILLPDLSSSYQVSILAYQDKAASSSNQRLTVDNFCVSVDTPLFLYNKDLERVGATYADISYTLTNVGAEITSVGVAISRDNRNWIFGEDEDRDGVVHFDDLQPGTIYYYQSYVCANGEYYYTYMPMFKTLSLTVGTGTEDDPLIISSEEDWSKLFDDSQNSGKFSYHALEHMHIKLNADITVATTYTFGAENPFYGSFDGNGHTITLSTPANGSFDKRIVNGLFGSLKSGNYIKNLTIKTGYLKTTGNVVLFVRSNKGLIQNCKAVLGTDSKSQYSKVTGIATMNMFGGLIQDCYAEYIDASRTVSGAGITEENDGTVTRCEFRGLINGSGIARVNHGVVKFCKNYGDITYIQTAQSRPENASIVGNNYNIVDNCVNYGTNLECFIGGIVGGNGDNGIVSNCYNAGHILNGTIAPILPSFVGTNPISGICSANAGLIVNCIYNGTVEPDFPYYDRDIRPIAFNHTFGRTENCYYSGAIASGQPDAEHINGYHLHTQELVDSLNSHADYDYWILTPDGVRLRMETDNLTNVAPPNFMLSVNSYESTRAEVSMQVLHNSESVCGLEYKEQDDSDWIDVPVFGKRSAVVTIDGLKELTSYDIRLYSKLKDGKKFVSKTEQFMTRYVQEKDTFYIRSLTDLRNFARLVGEGVLFPNKVVKLMSDIDMRGNRGELWTPIAEGFNGEFDGGGHYLKNMRVVITTGGYAGFFTKLENGYVHDLHFRNAHVENQGVYSNCYVGGIAAVCKNKIEKCSYQGTIIGGFYTGAIVGWDLNRLTNCYAIADILPANNYNGVSGYQGRIISQGEVENCYYAGTCFKKKINDVIGIHASSQPLVSNNVVINCYYEADETTGEKMTRDDMQNGMLISKLPSDIWVSDFATNPINGGFPLMLNQVGKNRISTQDAHMDEYGRIWLSAVYTRMSDRVDTDFGIEWRLKADDGNLSNRLIAESGDSIEVVLTDLEKGEYIFRGYATKANSDTIYGEWLSFKKNSELPTPYILGTLNDEDGNSVLEINVTNGNVPIDDYSVEYWPKLMPDDKSVVKLEDNVNSVILKNLIPDTRYEAQYVLGSNLGGQFSSKVYSWVSAGGNSSILEGDVNQDGVLSLADVVSTIGLYRGGNPSGCNVFVADVNKDGRIDKKDVIALNSRVFRQTQIQQTAESGIGSVVFTNEELDLADSSRMSIRLDIPATSTAFKVNIVLPKSVQVSGVRCEYRNMNLSQEVQWEQRHDTLSLLSFSWENLPVPVVPSASKVQAQLYVFMKEDALTYMPEMDVKCTDFYIVDSDCSEYRLKDAIHTLRIKDPYLIDGVQYYTESDYAVVAPMKYGHYKGRVVIPETVTIKGKTYEVRQLAPSGMAFADNEMESLSIPGTIKEVFSITGSKLKEVILNEGIQYIRANAFVGTAIESLHIPSTVSYIEGTVTEYRDNEWNQGNIQYLKSFTVATESPYFMAVDGVLYTKDGKQLVKVPPARQGYFAVPEGVEWIAYDAFGIYSNLDYIKFPSTVKLFGNFNFKESAVLEMHSEQFPARHRGGILSYTYTILVPSEYLDNYQHSENANGYKAILPIADCSLSVNEGWNWVSFNFVGRESCDALSFVEKMDGCDAILSQDRIMVHDPDYGWVGDMNLNTAEMFKMRFSKSQKLETIGGSLSSEDNPISIHHGWNWIGYNGAESMPFSKENVEIGQSRRGDVFLGQDGYVVHDDNFQWQGSLMLEPGKGYMYYSDYLSRSEITYHQPSVQASRSAIINHTYDDSNSEMYADDDVWCLNISDFQYDMTVYAKLVNNSVQVDDYSKYLVGAFVGDECRCIAEVQTVLIDGETYKWLCLRVRSNTVSGETVTFKVYERTTQTTLQLTKCLTFEDQSIVGLPSSSISLVLQGTVLGDANGDGNVNVGDITTVASYILGHNPSVFVATAADANQDGLINVGDITAIAGMILFGNHY